MLGLASLAMAQEKKANQPGTQQQESPPEIQEESKDIPTITNPVVFDEKNLDKLKEKQREYVKKHYANYQIWIEGEKTDYVDSRRYSTFDLENEEGEHIMTVRFDIEEAYQAYMKKHQKEIKRQAEELIKKGIIQIE